jgi:hypothetical protein
LWPLVGYQIWVLWSPYRDKVGVFVRFSCAASLVRLALPTHTILFMMN